MVNEFLTQMENYTGILICTTNLLNALDPASMRRFQWKVEFNSLTEENRLNIFNLYFKDIFKSLNKENISSIKKLTGLTPGDLKAVYEQVKYMDKKAISLNGVIDMLGKEIKYKTKDISHRVGFGWLMVGSEILTNYTLTKSKIR